MAGDHIEELAKAIDNEDEGAIKTHTVALLRLVIGDLGRIRGALEGILEVQRATAKATGVSVE